MFCCRCHSYYSIFKAFDNAQKETLDEIENGKTFTACINVKNTGKFDAKEIVECYVNDVKATMTRPIKELKGFEKVLIKQGETKTISFELGKNELGFYNSNGTFVVEKGKFKIYIGKDCLSSEYIEIEVI